MFVLAALSLLVGGVYGQANQIEISVFCSMHTTYCTSLGGYADNNACHAGFPALTAGNIIIIHSILFCVCFWIKKITQHNTTQPQPK